MNGLRAKVEALHAIAKSSAEEFDISRPVLLALCEAYLHPVCRECGCFDCECDEYD